MRRVVGWLVKSNAKGLCVAVYAAFNMFTAFVIREQSKTWYSCPFRDLTIYLLPWIQPFLVCPT